MDGILNVAKPAGMTSYRVTAVVKRLSGERRVGHAGTLDPAATGVLPVCLGRGTRVVEFLASAAKTYLAEIVLGIATDTFDADGAVTHRGDFLSVDFIRFESALTSFRGKIQQTPPMFSALKHRGQPLYRLARAGVSIERPSRNVTIHQLKVLSWRPPVVTLEIECSKGTYVRSLAHDLGQALGCGAHLKSLVRTRYGAFDIKNAVSLLKLEEAFRLGYGENYLHPIDSALQDYDAFIVDEAAESAVKNGRTLNLSVGNQTGERPKYCRAYSRDGRLLGMLRYLPASGLWHPKKVFV